MRIPFPERIPINRVALFALVLFLIQTVEGTALYFSAGCVVFILIAAFAFNAAGGLTRASGVYVFCYAVLVVIIGISYKAFLGEPAQSNLNAPRTDIEAYVATIAAMYASVIVSRRFSRKSGLLQGMLEDSKMHRASVGCIVFGVAGGFGILLLGESGAKLQSAFGQLNYLVPLGMLIGVMYEIRRSGGRRSINLATVLGALYLFVNGGILGFSKEAMLAPLLCWILPVCTLRFRLSAWHVLSFLLAVFMVFRYLAPYSQYGRSFLPLNATISQRLDVAIPLLEHPEKTRILYDQEQSEAQGPKGLNAYYNTPQGLWERLQFVSVDDKLIDFTDRGRELGLLPVKLGFINIIPHVFWPNKPTMNPGNFYAHEMGGLADDDTATGISFSATGEAYHLAKWTGILVIAPLLWCMFFIAFDSLLGDIRTTPWGLLAFVIISHAGPEGGVQAPIYLASFGVEILVFCAFFATWFAPLLATPILGPERRKAAATFSLPTPPVPR